MPAPGEDTATATTDHKTFASTTAPNAMDGTSQRKSKMDTLAQIVTFVAFAGALAFLVWNINR
jgi:hypothetical protein